MSDPRADPSSVASAASAPACVLVAEDDPSSRRLLALTLAASGFAVQTASGGKEAIERVVADPPDILLLDFQMPGLNGLEVCASLRHHVQAGLREIPIIMLTAHDGEAEEVACLHAGANDFVAKPIARPSLIARIETQLRLRALNAALRAQNDELAQWRAAQLAVLEAAQRVQRAILPAPGVLPGWRAATHYTPKIQVGGDIYGIETRGDGAVVWLADATGHGIAAALCTTLVAILFQRAAARAADPAEVLARVNAGLFAIFRGSSMMSAVCAHVAADGEIRVAGAGHPPMLEHRQGGRIEKLSSRSTLLGFQEEISDEAVALRLAPGDRALFFSDGLFSARRAGGTRQSLAEVAPALVACADLDLLVARMLGGSAFDDGVTALLLQRIDPGGQPQNQATGIRSVVTNAPALENAWVSLIPPASESRLAVQRPRP